MLLKLYDALGVRSQSFSENFSYTLIRTRACACKRVKNGSFSKSFVYVTNQ